MTSRGDRRRVKTGRLEEEIAYRTGCARAPAQRTSARIITRQIMDNIKDRPSKYISRSNYRSKPGPEGFHTHTHVRRNSDCLPSLLALNSSFNRKKIHSLEQSSHCSNEEGAGWQRGSPREGMRRSHQLRMGTGAQCMRRNPFAQTGHRRAL